MNTEQSRSLSGYVHRFSLVMGIVAIDVPFVASAAKREGLYVQPLSLDCDANLGVVGAVGPTDPSLVRTAVSGRFGGGAALGYGVLPRLAVALRFSAAVTAIGDARMDTSIVADYFLKESMIHVLGGVGGQWNLHAREKHPLVFPPLRA